MQAAVEAWQASGRVFLGRSSGLPRRPKPRSSSLRTSLPSEPVALEMWSGHLMLWGMTVDGLLYLPQPLEPRTKGPVGSCWPTPKTFYEKPATLLARKSRYHSENRGKKPGFSDLQVSAIQTSGLGGFVNPEWIEWLMNYPTGWSARALSETRSSPSKRGKRSGC